MTVKKLRKLLKKFPRHLRVFADDVANAGQFEPIHARLGWRDRHGTIHARRSEAGKKAERVVEIF